MVNIKRAHADSAEDITMNQIKLPFPYLFIISPNIPVVDKTCDNITFLAVLFFRNDSTEMLKIIQTMTNYRPHKIAICY